MREQLLPVIWLIGFSVITSVAGQTTIKLGVEHPDASSLGTSGALALIQFVLRSPLVLLGLFLYAISASAWIIVLSRVDLSYAYPFVALNFVLITIVSRLFLSETVPSLRWIGIGVICLGILLVARSGPGG